MKTSTDPARHRASSFGQLTRRDLAAFDQEATDLIMEAIELGCTGRISNRNHAILRNNTGGTAAVPRSMTTANRTSQNARAEVRRLMSRHIRDASKDQQPAPARPHRVTVAEAFEQYGMPFSNWLDSVPDGLPADAEVRVDPGTDPPSFSIETASTPESVLQLAAQSAGTPEPRAAEPEHQHVCADCEAVFGTASALKGHRRTHSSAQMASVMQVARLNAISSTTVRKRLGEAGARDADGACTITEETLRAAGLAVAYGCHLCPDAFPKQRGLRRHFTGVHGQPAISVLAHVHGLTQTQIQTRLEKVGALLPNGIHDRSPETLEKAGLHAPGEVTVTTAPTPSTPEATAESPGPEPAQTTERVVDPAPVPPPSTDAIETLERIRALLGDDPRIAELESRVADLTAQLAAAQQRADEALTRLALIQEAIHA